MRLSLGAYLENFEPGIRMQTPITDYEKKVSYIEGGQSMIVNMSVARLCENPDLMKLEVSLKLMNSSRLSCQRLSFAVLIK